MNKALQTSLELKEVTYSEKNIKTQREGRLCLQD